MSVKERFYESVLFIEHFGKWYVLALCSGAVNCGAFLACGRFVTHVTGFATLFGAGAAVGNWTDALVFSFVPAFFLLGAMMSAWMIDRPLNQGQVPSYRLPLVLVAVYLSAAAAMGTAGWFGSWGVRPMTSMWEFPLLALLCIASGTQNALLTSISGGVVRCSHLTGTTTDIGIGIVRIMYPPQNLDRFEGELRKLWLRVGTIVAYVLGSVLGAVVFMKWQYLGFLVPATLSLLVAFLFF